MQTALANQASSERAALARAFALGPDSDQALARLGDLEVRLASDAAEVEAAQEVRYRVFVEEWGAASAGADRREQRDADRYDAFCDHLLVIDTRLPGPDRRRVVGTYRLLRAEMAGLAGGFYGESEFDIAGLVARHPGKRFLELGRSCVLPQYRTRRAIEALWAGIWAYVRSHRIDVMAGCASFPGTVPAAHAQALSFLSQNCTAAAEWRVRAVAERYHPMDLMPAEAVDPRAAFGAMPTLVKGYLRLGGRVGDGCVVDRDFGTVDVFIVLPVEAIGGRYIQHYTGA